MSSKKKEGDVNLSCHLQTGSGIFKNFFSKKKKSPMSVSALFLPILSSKKLFIFLKHFWFMKFKNLKSTV